MLVTRPTAQIANGDPPLLLPPGSKGIMKRPIGSGPTLSLFDMLRQSAERRASAYPVPRSNSEFKAVRGQLNFNPRHVVPARRCTRREPGGPLFRRRRQTPTSAAPRAKRERLAQRCARQGCPSDPSRSRVWERMLAAKDRVSVAPYIVRRVVARASQPVAQAGGQDCLRQGLGIGGRGVDRALSPEAARERMMARVIGSSGHRPRRPCWYAAITSALRVKSGTLGSIARDRRGRVRRRPSTR